MRAVLARWRALYGASPLHLLSLVASFAFIGYVVHKASLGPLPERMGVWFVASFIGHDFILYPLYAVADRSLQAVISRAPRRGAQIFLGGPAARRARLARRAATVNAIRIPAAFSLLLLLIFQGPIRHQGDVFYFNASGLHEVDYLGRWLLTTGALFLISAVLFALHLGRNPSPDKVARVTSLRSGQGVEHGGL